MLTFKKLVEEKKSLQKRLRKSKEKGRKKTRSLVEIKDSVIRRYWQMLL